MMDKNDSEWGFYVFFEKRTKSCFFSKNPVFFKNISFSTLNKRAFPE